MATTIKWNHLCNAIVTECFIEAPDRSNRKFVHKYRCLWDTGAQFSAISPKVVADLGLLPSFAVQINHAGGSMPSHVYEIDMKIPQVSYIRSLLVTEDKMPVASDVLIGMDVISMGDFAICNKEGKTTFTFQVPSTHEIDFLEELDKE